MEKDPSGTLDAVASLGYAEVEFAGYFQHGPAEIIRMLDHAGLQAPCAHASPAILMTNPEEFFDTAALIGHRYVVLPWWEEQQRTLNGYTKLVTLLNQVGELAKERNIRLAYHNHDFEFSTIGAKIPYDFLLQETDPECVYFELDLYWAAVCKRDPIQLFADYPGRFPLLHAKDMDSSGNIADVGKGVIDFATIFEHASGGGLEHVFVEHDDPEHPMRSAAQGLAYINETACDRIKKGGPVLARQ